MSLAAFISICLVTNLWAMGAYALDKARAVRNQRRISEARLLGLTLLGGVGALTAINLFRHKTRKQPFRRNAELLGGLHVVVVAFTVTLLF